MFIKKMCENEVTFGILVHALVKMALLMAQ